MLFRIQYSKIDHICEKILKICAPVRNILPYILSLGATHV